MTEKMKKVSKHRMVGVDILVLVKGETDQGHYEAYTARQLTKADMRSIVFLSICGGG